MEIVLWFQIPLPVCIQSWLVKLGKINLAKLDRQAEIPDTLLGLTGMDMLIKQFINLSISQYVVAFFSPWKPTSQPSKKIQPF